MTPAPLRPETILHRLREMEKLLVVLAEQRALSGDDLRAHLRERLVTERALQQLVDLAVKINTHIATSQGRWAPEDYFSTFAAAAEVGAIDRPLAERLAPSTGLRNRLVHEYERIDLDQVAGAIPIAIDDYRAYVRAVAAWVADRADGVS